MSDYEEDKLVTIELEDHRIIRLDLDCEDDWGDIRVEKDIDTDEISVLIGNDCDGWVKAVRFFAELEMDDSEDEHGNFANYIQYKWQAFGEIELLKFVEWVLVREALYTDSETEESILSLLEEYGIKPSEDTIPDFIKEYLN